MYDIEIIRKDEKGSIISPDRFNSTKGGIQSFELQTNTYQESISINIMPRGVILWPSLNVKYE